MSTHDMNIANQSFPNFRTDLNNALGALVTNSSSTTEPATTFSHQWWVDTSASPSVVKIRNEANDAWVTIGTIDESGDTFTLTANATIPTLSVTGNTTLGDASGDSVTINASTLSTPNGLNFDSNTLVIDAANNNVGIGTSSPTGAGRILHINNSGTSSADVCDLRFTTGTTGATSGDGVRIRLANAGDLDINNLEANSVLISTQNTERMRIDSSGNVGVRSSGGTTPTYDFSTLGEGLFFRYWDSSGTRFADLVAIANTPAGATQNMRFFTNTGSAPGTAVERMRIDSSGRVGIGTSSPAVKFQSTIASSGVSGIASTAAGLFENSGNADVVIAAGTSSKSRVVFGDSGDWAVGRVDYDHSDNSLRFGTNGTAEHMRIDSSGNLLVGVTATIASERLNVTRGGSGLRIAHFENTRNISGDEILRTVLGSNCNNTSSYQFIGSITGTGDVIYIYGNGNIQNANNSYGALSDIKLKENIVDATPKLDDLMQVRVRNYNLIGSEQKQIGVVAQELEQVFPGLVDESQDKDAEGNPLETTTKGVKYSVFVPILIKAIQELKAENDALKSRLDAAGL